MGYKTSTFIGLDFSFLLMEQSTAWLTQRIVRDKKPIFSDSCLKALIFVAQPCSIRLAGQSRTVILIVLLSISRFLSLPILKNLDGFGILLSSVKFLYAFNWLEIAVKALLLIGLTSLKFVFVSFTMAS